jgi:ribosomal protein S18 acetylase RimI-like enzyme
MAPCGRTSWPRPDPSPEIGVVTSGRSLTLATVVNLRTVRAHDWRLWREVRLQALREAPEAFSSTLADWEAADEQRWRQRLDEVPFNVVALSGDERIGQASGTALGTDDSAELISVWVAPVARGTGVGDALVEAVCAWARQAGARAVRLSVRTANAPALRLYERTHFVLAKASAQDPSEVVMVRALLAE